MNTDNRRSTRRPVGAPLEIFVRTDESGERYLGVDLQGREVGQILRALRSDAPGFVYHAYSHDIGDTAASPFTSQEAALVWIALNTTR